MKVTLLHLLVMITISGFTMAQSNEKNNSSPTSAPTALTKISPNTNSTPIPPPAIAEKLANRTSTKLELSQMKKMMLNQQPETIIRMLFFFDDSNFENDNTATRQKKMAEFSKRKEIYLLERDLNYDGINERLIYDHGKDFTSSTLLIFKLEGKTWKHLFLQNGDIVADKNKISRSPIDVELLSSGLKDDFDILKMTEITPAAEEARINKSVNYYVFEENGFNEDILYPEMTDVYSKDSYLPFYRESYYCSLTNGIVNESFPCELKSVEERDQLRRRN
jgi:hypothetical protein